MSPRMLQRVRYWRERRSGKADGVGQIIDGPMWVHLLDGPVRCWRVLFDEGGSEWLSEAQIERELPNGAGVKA